VELSPIEESEDNVLRYAALFRNGHVSISEGQGVIELTISLSLDAKPVKVLSLIKGACFFREYLGNACACATVSR
jgi:hypothetical protein